MNKKQKKMLWRIIASAIILIIANVIPSNGVLIWVRMVFCLVSYLVIGYDILKKAFRGILNGRIFDENFLMAVATIGAIALGIYEQKGDYNEASCRNAVLSDRRAFSRNCRWKKQKNISALMNIARIMRISRKTVC